MGMDMIMNIHKGKDIIAEDIFPGRNREWFCNLRGDGSDIYDKLPLYYDIPDDCPPVFKDTFEEEGSGNYSFRWMKVDEFQNWYEKTRPDIDAGWVHTYDKWLYEKKGVKPYEVYKYLPDDVDKEDMHFIEFRKYECGRWLYEYLVDNNIPKDAIITYWFNW